jgi:hypothetical protein
MSCVLCIKAVIATVAGSERCSDDLVLCQQKRSLLNIEPDNRKVPRSVIYSRHTGDRIVSVSICRILLHCFCAAVMRGQQPPASLGLSCS